MPRYWFFISNNVTRQCIDVVAESAEQACSSVGWRINDCAVIQVGEMQVGTHVAPIRQESPATRPPTKSPPRKPHQR